MVKKMRTKKKLLRKVPDYSSYPYAATDKGIDYLSRIIVRFFGTLDLDELHRLDNAAYTIEKVNELFKKLDIENRKTYRRIYYSCYREAWKELQKVPPPDELIDYMFLEEMYDDYDHVTGYVYSHEVERKTSRTAENIIASEYQTKAKDAGMRYWAIMAFQYAVTASDRARYKAYRNSGVEYFKWVAEIDEKTCEECIDYDGEIFRYDEIPEKPHFNCRCYIVPAL